METNLPEADPIQRFPDPVPSGQLAPEQEETPRKKRSFYLTRIGIPLLVFLVSFALTDSGHHHASTAKPSAAPPPLSATENTDEAIIDDPKIEQARADLLRWLNRQTGPAYNAPNAVLVLIHKDKVIIKQAVKTTNDHLFNAASHTKLFTLLAILQLADQGVLDIDKPLSDYIEEDLTRKDLGSAPVTIRHMLSHTSGFMFGTKQSFRTGRGYHYSNEGYNLLGEMISRLSGKPLAEYVKENIIDPLGMPHADPTEMKGAAFLKWSLEDMAIMLKLIQGKGQYNGQRIVSERWFTREIYQPVQVGLPLAKRASYRGLAFKVLSIDDRPFAINHAALTPGSGGWFHYYPQHEIGFIIMTNSPTANLLDEIALRHRGDREKEREERAENKRFLPRVHLDPHFGAWYSSFTKQAYAFMKVLSDADINPTEFQETGSSAEIANRYAGRYVQPDSQETIEIAAIGGGLSARLPGDRLTLLASGPERFYSHKDNELFFFIRTGETMHSLLYKYQLFVRQVPESESERERTR